MPITNPVGMASYIVAMGAAARVAQATMSAGANPMIIKEFRFDVNVNVEYSFESETDISLNIFVLSVDQKVTVGYKAEWGLEIECTIIPTVALET